MRDALLLAAVALAVLATFRHPFVGLLAWAWFTLMSPHQMAYGVYGLPLNVVIAAATIVSLAVRGEFRRFRPDARLILIGALAFWIALSQNFSLNPEASAVYVDRFLKTLAFVALCLLAANTKLRIHALIWTLVIAMGFFAAKGAIFTIVNLGQYHVQGPIATVIEDNNHLGIAMATSLPMILYLRNAAARSATRKALTALFFLTMFAVLGTQSRGAFICLVVFGLYFFVRSNRKGLIVAAVTVVVVPMLLFMPAQWSDRMSTIANASEDASFMGRVDAWIINTEFALQHPLTGAGLRNPYDSELAAKVDPERAPRAKAAHSIYFEMLGGSGFVGLAIYLSLLGSAFLSALALHRRNKKSGDNHWTGEFGYFAQMSIVIFAVGGASASMEMWDGYLLIIALIGAAAKLSAARETGVAGTRTAPAMSWRMRARSAGA